MARLGLTRRNLAVLLFGLFCAPAIAAPRLAAEYLDILATYALHAKSIWHKAQPGGYWGDGIDASNQNGAVRGTASTMLTYSMLARAWKEGWLPEERRRALEQAGLTRPALIRYTEANLQYLNEHHKSNPATKSPQWGYGWQSSLWLGSIGPAVLLNWDELTSDSRAGVTRVAIAEADRIAAMKPKDYHPNDTGAEENGWNTAAPALALALAPGHDRAESWWRALRVFALNTYSVPGDGVSIKEVGSDRVSELVSTANLFSDFTLNNHGFFHPDYVQVSGQHLGEAWQILQLGDQLNGTSYAEQFEPYSLHHVEDVWREVLRPLLLPDGEFAFPSGNDWTFHCSTTQSYLAFIATALQDPVAAEAEERALRHVRRRREASPAGRLLGDSNLEWWWEPLVAKRCTTALLHHWLRPVQANGDGKSIDTYRTTKLFPDSEVWVHRNESYFVSASWGKRRMGTFTPLGAQTVANPYVTLPIEGMILPDSVSTATQVESGCAKALMLEMPGGKRTAVVALPKGVLWLSPEPLRGLAVENDTLTTPGRMLKYRMQSGRLVRALGRTTETLEIESPWMTIDGRLALLAPGGFTYQPAGRWNGKSVAYDVVSPRTATASGKMPDLPSSPSATGKMPVPQLHSWFMYAMSPGERGQDAGADFEATYNDGIARVMVRDASGETYRIGAVLEGTTTGSLLTCRVTSGEDL